MPLSNKQLMVHILDEYGELDAAMDDTNDGICRNCGHVQSNVEPDARNYACESCKKDMVFGIEETVMRLLQEFVMNKLNLSDLLFSDSPPPPKVVCDELKKVFSFVRSINTNEPFFNMKFVCSDDDEQTKLAIKYGYRVKTERRPDVEERWFYDIIAAEEDE